MNEILPPERVILDKHDPSHKQAFEQYLSQRESYKPAPTGKMDVATFREANSENLHLAANVPAEIASDPQQPAAVRLKASEIIRDNALGRDAVSLSMNGAELPAFEFTLKIVRSDGNGRMMKEVIDNDTAT